MDTVMVLSILNVALPVSPVFGVSQDMIRAGVPNDKREQTRGPTNPLSESSDILEKARDPKGKGT